MTYRRQKKRPNMYRFLAELYPTFIAVILAWFLDRFGSILCTMHIVSKSAHECSVSFPSVFWWGLGALAAYGLVAAWYRFYRDFFKGDYFLDRSDF